VLLIGLGGVLLLLFVTTLSSNALSATSRVVLITKVPKDDLPIPNFPFSAGGKP